jgi:hypothetical protein
MWYQNKSKSGGVGAMSLKIVGSDNIIQRHAAMSA